MQANRKHSAKNRCDEKSATVWVSPCKQTASEQIKQRREIPTKTQAGPANHDRGTRIKNSRSESTGNRRKGGVVLQANCKQWVQERPGSVRNLAVAGNAKDQVRIYFLPLGSAQGHSKYHPKWLFKSPLRHDLHFPWSQPFRGRNVERGTACLRRLAGCDLRKCGVSDGVLVVPPHKFGFT